MASLFKGMSKDNFLDSLVEKTGLNGHELYDYLISLMPKEKKEEEKVCDWYPTKEIARFSGKLSDIQDYMRTLGANEKVIAATGGMTLGYIASILCSLNRVKRFELTTPVRILSPNMRQKERIEDRTYIGYWNEEEKHYSFF